MSKILVVEDDEIINQVVVDFLRDKNYEVSTVFDGEKALEIFKQHDFDLIILDVMLPILDGTAVLKKIRETSEIPVIMLTAVEDEYTQLISFNQLIDDYVIKPFSPTILMKRVENVLRKNQKSDVKKVTINGVVIDFECCEVWENHQLIRLTKTEYEILAYLAKRVGKTVLREYLVENIWEYDGYEDNRILDNHMKNLRKKVPSVQINTIKGIGYKIEENI